MRFQTAWSMIGMLRSLAPNPVRYRRGAVLLACLSAACAGLSFAHAADGGAARFDKHGKLQQFGNATLAANWQIDGDKLGDVSIEDKLNRQTLPVSESIVLTFADGTRLAASDWRVTAAPKPIKLSPDAKASRLAERLPGSGVAYRLSDRSGRLRIDWQWVQRDGSDYLRAIATVTALKQDEAIAKIELLQLQTGEAAPGGSVAGSPVLIGRVYAGLEHPLAENDATSNYARLSIASALPLLKGKSVTYSAVVGTTHEDQLRRNFLTYLERERAHPYRTFLHYNSWYDIGYFTPYTQAQALDRIAAFGDALTTKRQVKLDSFLFDDGWDDRSGSWHFSRDFPDGFVPLRDAAAKYAAAPGVWLSPWGGYGNPKKERVTRGQASGYEIIDEGFALSGPRYYQRFRDAVLDLVNQQGINQFKFDGTGNAKSVFPGSRFNSDFDAAIALIDDLRSAKPDLYINLTTGTAPSPFWLRYADSIWRDGEDHAFAGVGSHRQRWITYRDAQTYANIVVRGPLFPLNALMLHGLIYAQEAHNLNTDPEHDFASEVHSYFATGTQLQEMYITPSLLREADWDVLGEAARWSRRNADVLRDTHWIGGDPGHLNVYGWAAWTPAKAILTLRNPDANPQMVVIDLARQLELPPGAARRFSARSPWASDANNEAMTLDADHPQTLTLAPFQVLTLELIP